jgi:type I restriction enzyme S subunit
MEVMENIEIAKYAEYKDSGTDWLGSIPASWECIRMKHVFADVSEKNRPDAELLSVTQDQGVVPRSFVENRMVMPSGNLHTFKFIREGDFAISLRSFEGGLEYCYHDGIISPAYTVLRTKRKLVSSYYKYLFKSYSFISELQTSIVGIREGKNISFQELSYSILPIPTLPEQTRIAQFLDRKTAQIDKAIAQKEKLIELLKERRQILIHNAVTRGLNPHVKMKPSGVEWIGEIPEHWEVMKLNHIVELLVDGTHFSPKSSFEGEYKYVTAKNIRENGFDFTELTYITKKDHDSIYKRCPVKKGDILYIKDGATAGIAMINDMEEEFSLLSSVAVIRLKSLVNNEFLKYYLNSNLIKTYVSTQINGGAITRLTLELIKIFKIVVPPEGEQLLMVEQLIQIDKRISKSIVNENTAIEKLKEYKSTLINSAVTGKIKV